jgi:hypothetical protein
LRFLIYGFLCDEPRAYGVPLTLHDVFGRSLVVQANLALMQGNTGVESLLPKVEQANGQIVLSHLLLGNRAQPWLPRSILRRSLPGFSHGQTDEVFERVFAANLTILATILGVLEGHEDSMCRVLRTATRMQLAALAHSYGAQNLDALVAQVPR